MTKKTISLVLSSGGARGLAHIGAIHCLEEEGYDIHYISGTSMGALVGGIYAAGKLKDYEDWVRALRRKDMVQLLDFGWGHGSLFKGERIIEVLKDLIGEHSIEDLPIGFTAVAADLKSKREVLFNKGPLFSAIRASIAMPLVFSPVIAENKVLVDGGILNPLPITPTLNNGTDLTVAVDVNGADDDILQNRTHSEGIDSKEMNVADDEDNKLSKIISLFVENLLPASNTSDKKDNGILDTAIESMDTMQVSIARYEMSICSPDVTIQIPRNIASFFEFERANELIDTGYEQMRVALHSLK